MEAITIPHIHIPSIDIGGICLPGIGVPDGGKKGLIWPKGLKESIKAIYDPAKQGMTNYDVIEAYVEDFTVWGKNTERYTGSITNKTINITEVSKANSICVYSSPKKLSTKLYITGIADGQNIIFGNADTPNAVENIVVSGDGLYNIDSSQFSLYFGIGFGFTGSCNITITQLPTSILKDFSGNGNHAYLYGGKGKLNSGMGVYQTDFSSWNYYPSLSTVEYSPKGLVIKKVNGTAQFCASDFVGKFTAEVSGIPEGVSFYYRYIDKTTGNTVSITLSNGINEVDCSNANGDADMTNMFLIGANNKDINITITQIPDYPDQLCYDGKMYAVCYGFPILEDYTVMADRTWFDKTGVRCFCSKYKDNTAAALFKFEWVAGNKEYTSSLGKDTNVVFVDSNITWQTKTSYNGKALTNLQYEDGEHLIIGNRYEGDYSTYIGCHGKIIIADRSFTEDEITWLKDNWKKI